MISRIVSLFCKISISPLLLGCKRTDNFRLFFSFFSLVRTRAWTNLFAMAPGGSCHCFFFFCAEHVRPFWQTHYLWPRTHPHPVCSFGLFFNSTSWKAYAVGCWRFCYSEISFVLNNRTAVYSAVHVHEIKVRGVVVMLRATDAFFNATHMLKVARYNPNERKHILKKDICVGKHDTIRGGNTQFQGTWWAHSYLITFLDVAIHIYR